MGGEGADRGRDGRVASLTQMDMNLSKLRETLKTGEPGVLQFMGFQRVGHVLATEQSHESCQSNKNDKMMKMINEYRMDDTRNLYLMIPKEIIRLGNNHQWLVKPFRTAGTR